MYCNGFGLGGYGYGGFGFGGIAMMIGFLLILGLVIYFIYQSGRRTVPSKAAAYEEISPRAIEILNERFARGEISEEEYRSRKNQILNH
ncbi:SHOCT domain-containing protein [Caproicibacter sp.]|uniref:SHOCT domain-containing protein n=1 Tax=Caproicibacter sp. TaxID=2814884 RepID=UPI003989064D